MLLIRYLSLLFYTALVCGVKVIRPDWKTKGRWQVALIRWSGSDRRIAVLALNEPCESETGDDPKFSVFSKVGDMTVEVT